MLIGLGILTGILGFLPLFFALRLSRRSTSTSPLTVGLYGLGGVSVSLVILVVGLLLCAVMAREQIVPFAVKGDAKTVCQCFPGEIMVFISGADDSVQVKYDSFILHRLPLSKRRSQLPARHRSWKRCFCRR